MTKLSAPVATLGVVVFGTAASLIAKLIYSVSGLNSRGEIAPFTKPWFQVLAMFAGMSICIVLDLPKPSRHRDLSACPGEHVPLVRSDHSPKNDTDTFVDHSASVWIINVPTLFDLFATACGTTGLIYTTVSVYQMLRGAQLIFTALLSVMFLRRRLSPQNLSGILFCVAGIILVGLANIWGESSPRSRKDTTFGVLVILAGQVLQASQVVLEEHLLKNLSMSSVRIVAFEGMFGCLHCLLWVFPIVFFLPGNDAGHMEDPMDTFFMFSHSWKIAAVVVLDMAIMLAYNICGMEVTNNLSAVSRVIIETLRTLFVWLSDILLFYVISAGRLGEQWTPYSYLQALGFMLTVAGTICYNYEHLAADFRRRRKAAAAAKADASLKVDYGIIGDHSGLVNSDVESPKTPAAPFRDQDGIESARLRKGEGVGRTSQPVSMQFGDDYIGDNEDGQAEEEEEEEEEEDDEANGFFVGSAVGSASHGSYLAGSLTSSSLRRRTP